MSSRDELFQIIASMTAEQIQEFLNHPEVKAIIGYEATEAYKAMMSKQEQRGERVW